MSRPERGSAVLELVLLGVPLLVPLLYLAVVLTAVRQAGAGVTEAARQAGRAYAGGAAGTARARAADAARRALADRGVPTDGMRIRYGTAGSACDREAEPLRPGLVVTVCVTARVPDLLPGGSREITGRFLVRTDDYRDYR